MNVAYSAWSTIKIPVLISAFRRLSSPYDETVLKLMEQMVDRSDNDSTDALAKVVIGSTFAPLDVTKDMQALGLTNTFWSRFFMLGSPPYRSLSPGKSKIRLQHRTRPLCPDYPEDLGLLLKIFISAQKNTAAHSHWHLTAR